MTNGINLNKQFQLGDIVRINFGPDQDMVGYVYEEYDRGVKEDRHGISVITYDGRDLGGWSGAEQKRFLTFLRHSGFYYQFENVIKLKRDFDNHVFDEAFKEEGGEK